MAEDITDELFGKMLEELKYDMEVLLLNDPRINSLLKSESKYQLFLTSVL